MTGTAAARVPELRQDLIIVSGAPARTGAPAWTIYDPLLHRYHQIDSETRQLLSIWQPGATFEELAATAARTLGLATGPDEIARLAAFLHSHHLAVDDRPGAWREMKRRADAAREGPLMRLLHHYLFFRVPLFRPERFLQATFPFVSWLYNRWTMTAILAAGLLGLYLASRQWQTFVATVQDFMSIEGAVAFSLTLIVVKALHELGHAYTAHRFGCRVPTIGIAFVLGAPLLYTDVTDAWRLTSRRQRLLIDSAGITVELAIACLATLAWAFLPDGPTRAVAFALATTGWLLSLLINLNPLMRFDGYYLLSDLVAIDNLQPRAFAIGSWQLRRLLLAPDLPPPEPFSAPTRAWLVVYAWSVWLYRLVLFTGIALLVYAMFFKVLGVILFMVEIFLLVLRPIASELAQWRKVIKAHGSRSRVTATCTLLTMLVVVASLPLSTIVHVPAIIEARSTQQLFAPRPSRIEHFVAEPGAAVSRGDVLARLSSPELDHDVRITAVRIALTERRLARIAADGADREETLVLTRQLESLRARRTGLLAERDELVLRAPGDGVVLERNHEAHAGQWIGRTEPLALIGDHREQVVRGYVPGSDVERFAIGATGTFVPDDRSMPILPVRLATLARGGAMTIEIAELASLHAGPIATEPDERQQPVPRQAHYMVELTPVDAVAPLAQTVRGVVRLEGQAESLLGRIARQILKVLIRESGT